MLDGVILGVTAEEVQAFLAAHPEVPFAAATTGSTNLFASVLCPDASALYTFRTQHDARAVLRVLDLRADAKAAGFRFF